MKIEKIIPGEGYLITVLFDNKQSVTVDLKDKLKTVRFSELRKQAVFYSAITDGRAILWPGGLSMAISEIQDLAGK